MGPWGYTLIAAALALTTEGGRTVLKSVLKTGLRVGMEARDGMTELVDKANDYKEELLAEIKADEQALENQAELEKNTIATIG